MVFITRAILTASILLGWFLFLPQNSLAKNLFYTKADLEILQQGKNFDEFFKHAKDIIPTQRDTSWLNMVSDMASQMVDDYRQNEHFEDKFYENVQELNSWPELKRDEFFQVKRNAYSLEYLKRCLINGNRPKESCLEKMKGFWKTARKDPDLGHKLLVLAEGFFPQGNHWEYLEKTVSSEFSKFYCHRPLVRRAFDKRIEELDLDPLEPAKERKRLELMANKECWNKVSDHLNERLMRGEAKDQIKVFDLLEVLELTKPIAREAFLIKYYLEGPTTGRILNLAWTSLDTLSQNYTLRKDVLKMLMNLDPLPGQIFANIPGSRTKVLSDHLAKNFPEYINSYSKVCTDYLSGKRSFPYGNPTIHCHDLFKQDEKKPISQRMISQPLSIRYSAIMKGTTLAKEKN